MIMIKFMNFYQIYSDFAYHVEQHYFLGCFLTPDQFFGIVDECFIDMVFQDYRDVEVYQNLSGFIPTDILDTIFESLFERVNNYLDIIYRDGNRFTIPESVYYLGDCKFRIHH